MSNLVVRGTPARSVATRKMRLKCKVGTDKTTGSTMAYLQMDEKRGYVTCGNLLNLQASRRNCSAL